MGTKGNGQKKLFSEKGIKPGASDKHDCDTVDVGKIKGFIIDLENDGKFRPVEVTITNKRK